VRVCVCADERSVNVHITVLRNSALHKHSHLTVTIRLLRHKGQPVNVVTGNNRCLNSISRLSLDL